MTVIARWLIDNASSGVMSGTLIDNTGNNNTLTVSNANSDGSWTSIGSGKGFTANAAVNAANSMACLLSDISANGNIGLSLANKTKASIRLVADLITAGAATDHVFFVGTSAGNGDIRISVSGTLSVGWDRENTGGYLNFPLPSGLTVIDAVIDTTQATANDRIKVYYNGVAQAVSGGVAPAQNTALTSVNAASRYVSLFNRPNLNRNGRGALYYAELHDDALTFSQITDGVSALQANNDADWAANQDPQLDTPQADVVIQEGQTGTIDCGANFSDANAGDTLTYSISPAMSAGFSFNTSTGVITYNGSQIAATAVSYTVTADDGNGGTPATDTFTITVTAPELAIDSVSSTAPEAGSQLTFNISNKQGTISASCSAGTISIVSQDASTVVVTTPNPVTFGSKTLNFNTNVTVTLDDGSTTAAQVIQIAPQTGTQTAEIITIDADGIYANDVGITAGMFGYAYNFTGDVLVDLTDGLVAAGSLGGSFRYMIYDGVWGDYALASYNATTTKLTTQTIDLNQWVVGSGGIYRGNDKLGNL